MLVCRRSQAFKHTQLHSVVNSPRKGAVFCAMKCGSARGSGADGEGTPPSAEGRERRLNPDTAAGPARGRSGDPPPHTGFGIARETKSLARPPASRGTHPLPAYGG